MNKKWLAQFTRNIVSATEIQNVLYVGGSELADIRDYAPRSYWTAICSDVPEDFEPFSKFNDFALDSIKDIPWEIYFDFDLTYMLEVVGSAKEVKEVYDKALENSRFLVIQLVNPLVNLYDTEDDVFMKHDSIFVAAKADSDKDILQEISQDLV